MISHYEIKKSCYFDSVTLMLFSSRLLAVQGVQQAAVMMATDHNKALMLRAGVLDEQYAAQAAPNDLLIGILAEEEVAVRQALQVLEEQFASKNTPKASEVRAKTLEGAVKKLPKANLAIISLPGAYAKYEAMKCLQKGLHVLLFSDNISVEDELELKTYAQQQGLLMMGPDCGTAILGGTALGFANVVRRGNIGLVAASGTGLQEVTVLVDRFGGGISQAIGTGGRDLKESIGGITMLSALEALADDPATQVIGILSKPPHPAVMQRILQKAQQAGKPVVACFLGGDPAVVQAAGIIPAATLEAAAAELVKLAGLPTPQALLHNELLEKAEQLCRIQAPGRQLVRGIYTGGTLCYEALLILQQSIPNLYSNIATNRQYLLQDPETSRENTLLDMGEDYFTNGVAHPMIDPRLRGERILREAQDPHVAVMLLDCVLGYGSHEDPAGELAAAVRAAKANGGEDILYIASVCGTRQDPQSLSAQIEKLEAAGILVLPSNAQAAALAARVVAGKGRSVKEGEKA